MNDTGHIKESNKNKLMITLYGAQHPPLAHLLDTKNNTPNNKLKTEFHAFQKSLDDAWDIIDINECSHIEMPNDLNNIPRTSENTLDNSTKDGLYPPLSMLNSLTPPNHTQANSKIKSLSLPTNIGNAYKTANRLLASEQDNIKFEKLNTLLHSNNLDLSELSKLSWSGVHPKFRPTVWKLLSHYIPTSLDQRAEVLIRKRKEYLNFVEKYYPTRFDDIHKDMYRQIHIDIPRMNPLIDLFQLLTVQEIFERILYIWAMRHPASGYVQGINDLVTPYFVVFLSEYVPAGTSVDTFDINTLSLETRQNLEADSFWCVSYLLNGIQDNYTFAQPGIQAKVNSLKHLISRINASLYNHLTNNEVEFLQFSFRWMNNLLMREIPLKCSIRLWDTYLSEPDGFSHFHLYVCAAFLNDWSQRLLNEKDFQGIMLLIQNLPTRHWAEKEISMILAEAFKLKYIFADSPRHIMAAQSNITLPNSNKS